MKDFKKLTAYDESVTSVATDHTEPMKDIKDKPDFEKLAMKLVGEGCACGHVEEGMEKIWNDYHLPLLEKLERLQQNYELQQGVLDSYRKRVEELEKPS